MTPIPAIIFLLLEPYKTNPFVRFHSFQMIFFCLACFALSMTATIMGVALSVVGMTPIFAFLEIIINMGSMVVWLILVLKAYQGEIFKLPVIGDFAAKQALIGTEKGWEVPKAEILKALESIDYRGEFIEP